MTWKTDIPELIKTLIAGVECEYETACGASTGRIRYFENEHTKNFQLKPYGDREFWSAVAGFAGISRWRPARPKVNRIAVRESYNGLWSFYTGNARIYTASKPDLQQIQALDKDRDYSEAKVQYCPYPRIKLEPVGVTGVAQTVSHHVGGCPRTFELWIAGEKCVPCDTASARGKAKVGRINVSVYYDHVSITLRSGGTCCKANFIKRPSMADMADMFPDLDFSEAYFSINE